MASSAETPESGLDVPHALPYSSTLPYPFVMQHVMGAAFGRHTECYRLVHGSEGDGDGVLPQDCELHLFIHLQIKKSELVGLCFFQAQSTILFSLELRCVSILDLVLESNFHREDGIPVSFGNLLRTSATSSFPVPSLPTHSWKQLQSCTSVPDRRVSLGPAACTGYSWVLDQTVATTQAPTDLNLVLLLSCSVSLNLRLFSMEYV